MNHINYIETDKCEFGKAFDIIHLKTGEILVVGPDVIGCFRTAEDFEKGDPLFIFDLKPTRK